MRYAMSGDIDPPGDTDQVEEDPVSEVSDDDVVLTTDDDISNASTMELNVEKLVEAVDADEAARQREIKEKLDALNEGRDDDFGSTYNFDLDKDL
jgi:hypothetical protein